MAAGGGRAGAGGTTGGLTVVIAFDKSRFFTDMEYVPHPGQREVHASPARRRVVACGVRWGKTMAAAMEGLAAAVAPAERSIGWVVAPTYDLADRVYREITYVAVRRLRHRVVTIKDNERRMVLRNLAGGLSEVRAKSADNPVSLLGEGLDWLIVDEAARLKSAIWQGHLVQRLLDRRGWALLISTPRGKGWFYDLYRLGQGQAADHASWNYPSWTNPMLDAEEIERERARLPERVFRQEYGAEFIEGSGAVFRNLRECATGGWCEPRKGEVYSAGLDLARVEDFTVLVIVDSERRVVHVERFTKVDWSLQVQRVQAAADRYHGARILVDSTGVGEPVFEALRTEGCRVEPYPFTTKSKAALIDNLALMLEQKLLQLPRPELWPEGLDELEAYEFSVTESGHVRTGAPGGAHDDCVVALALAAWQVRPSRPRPRIVLLEGRLTGPTW